MSGDGRWWLYLPPCPRCNRSHVLTDCGFRYWRDTTDAAKEQNR